MSDTQYLIHLEPKSSHIAFVFGSDITDEADIKAFMDNMNKFVKGGAEYNVVNDSLYILVEGGKFISVKRDIFAVFKYDGEFVGTYNSDNLDKIYGRITVLNRQYKPNE